MAIEVVTDGPGVDPSTSVPSSIRTFADLMSDIADDIDDTTDEYASQIKKAILGAILYCEREPFYFNETRDISFYTVPGKDTYTAADEPNIPTIVHISAVYCNENGNQRLLSREMPEDLEILLDNSASRGTPYAYTYFAQSLRLYPIPGEAQLIRIEATPYRLAPMTLTSDTNAWLTEAYDMIKARAKYIVAKDILKDATTAAEALNDFEDQKSSLKAETSRRIARGRIVATCF